MSEWGEPIFDVYVNEEYHYTEIMEGLVLGTVEGANCNSIIDLFGIKRILTVGKALRKELTDRCDYLSISIYDSRNEDIYQFFEKTFQYIDKAFKDKAPIFVHCAEGISRSSTIVMAYLIKKYRWSYVEAYNFVAAKRSVVNPNKTFEKQLIEYHLRINTKVFTDKRFLKPDKKHATNTKLRVLKEEKRVKFIKKGKKRARIFKFKPIKLNLKDSCRDNYLIKFCRYLGNKLMDMDKKDVESKKKKLYEISKRYKDYKAEVVDVQPKRSKQFKRKLDNDVRKLILNYKKEIIESFFNPNYEQDKERLRPSELINSKR
jgi:protein-tyrosine phosphatase